MTERKGDSTDKAWLDHDDPTVGGLHPSDLGHYRIAEFYAAMLPPLLATSDARAAAQTAELAAVAAVKAAEAALEPAGVLSAAERELHELQTKLMQHEASADAPPAPKPPSAEKPVPPRGDAPQARKRWFLSI